VGLELNLNTMGVEQPRQSNEGNSIEHEKEKLEANLDELSGHLEELESSDSPRKEKVMEWFREHQVILMTTLIGLGAGGGEWAHGGTVEDFLFKTGLGVLFGGVAEFAMYKGRKSSEARRKRMEMENNGENR